MLLCRKEKRVNESKKNSGTGSFSYDDHELMRRCPCGGHTGAGGACNNSVEDIAGETEDEEITFAESADEGTGENVGDD